MRVLLLSVDFVSALKFANFMKINSPNNVNSLQNKEIANQTLDRLQEDLYSPNS